jgi:hypothetical protein
MTKLGSRGGSGDLKRSAVLTREKEKPKKADLKIGHYDDERRVAGLKPHTYTGTLLVFLVDGADGAGFVEGDVEGFGFFYEDVGELFFLDEGHGLELDHFEDR